MTKEIDLNSNDFEESRYARLELIPWWNQKLLENTTVLVVGAGAIGNELIKNLAMLGIGRIIIADMDKVEKTNLTRSVLYRMEDIGKFKCEAAAKAAMELNPDVRAVSLCNNIITEVGLGVFREADIVLGGLDNREARLHINQSCYKLNKTWIDGAIEALSGFARVFQPPGPCYECTMTETDWKLINKRKSCALLTHEEISEGKIPTTPTSSSVIAGIQVQEMLKLLHKERNLPTLAGKGYVFNGLTHDSYVVEYQLKDNCMSHDLYENIIEKDWSVRETSFRELVSEAAKDLGEGAVIELDRDIVTYASCSCSNRKEIFKSTNSLRGKDIICENCGKTMTFETIHTIRGNEEFANKTLFEAGIPLFHIVGARKGFQYIYYEFSKDKKEVLGGLYI